MASVAIALAAAGAAVGAFGQLKAGQAQVAEAKSQQRVSEYNALIAQREAQAEQHRGVFAQTRQAQEAARQMSALRAGFGAAGVVPTEGAPVAALAEQAAESELEQLLIGYESQLAQERLMSESELRKMEARAFRRRGKAARTASYFRAGTTLLTGFGKGAQIAGGL